MIGYSSVLINCTDYKGLLEYYLKLWKEKGFIKQEKTLLETAREEWNKFCDKEVEDINGNNGKDLALAEQAIFFYEKAISELQKELEERK